MAVSAPGTSTDREFDEWLDGQFEGLTIETEEVFFQAQASHVLKEMDPVGYTSARDGYMTMRQEELKQFILECYPMPVAHYLHRAERGYENNIQRLHTLRDVWEALIFLLHALIVGESRFLKLPLATSGLKMDDLYSDRIHSKLRVIQAINRVARAAGVELETAALTGDDILDQIRDLNQKRNGFSHVGALSETQARELYIEHAPEVFSVLSGLSDLAGVALLRYVGQTDDIYQIRCEVFGGSSMTRQYENLPLTSEQLAASAVYLNRNTVLSKCGKHLFSLAPFLHYREDTSGYVTYLCFYKRKAGDLKYTYEIVGRSEEIDLDRVIFDRETSALRELLQKA